MHTNLANLPPATFEAKGSTYINKGIGGGFLLLLILTFMILMNKGLIIGVIVIILIIAGGTYYLSSNSTSKAPTAPQSTTYVSTIQPTTTIASPIVSTSASTSASSTVSGSYSSSPNCAKGSVNTGGGAGQSYMSSSEASGLFGSSGTYCATGEITGKANIAQYITSYGSNGIKWSNSSSSNNVTAAWLLNYTTNNTRTVNGKTIVRELVFQSPQAKQLYENDIKNLTGLTINSSVGGMTYSYINSTQYFSVESLIGYKNNELVSVSVVGQGNNIQQVASITSGDMP